MEYDTEEAVSIQEGGNRGCLAFYKVWLHQLLAERGHDTEGSLDPSVRDL